MRFSAILTSVVIATVNIFAAEFNSAESALIDVALESEDGWYLELIAGRPGNGTVILKNFNLTLEP